MPVNAPRAPRPTVTRVPLGSTLEARLARVRSELVIAVYDASAFRGRLAVPLDAVGVLRRALAEAETGGGR